MTASFSKSLRTGIDRLFESYTASSRAWNKPVVFSLLALPASLAAACILALIFELAGSMIRSGLIGKFFGPDFLFYLVVFYGHISFAATGVYCLYYFKRTELSNKSLSYRDKIPAYIVFVLFMVLLYTGISIWLLKNETSDFFYDSDYAFGLKLQFGTWINKLWTSLTPILLITISFLLTQFYLTGKLDRAYFKKFRNTLLASLVLAFILLAVWQQLAQLLTVLLVDFISIFYPSEYTGLIPKILLQFGLYVIQLVGMQVVFTLPQVFEGQHVHTIQIEEIAEQ